MHLREAAFDTGEVVLNYAEGLDNGPPFVLLHGGSGRWQYGEEFLRLLSRQWRVFAPDFLGHGRSSRGRTGYRLEDYVRDTTAFLSAVVPKPAVVYGHSLGGEVAVKTAANRPDLFHALIVGDAPLSVHNLATEESTHKAQNELWQRLAGRSVDKIVPALKNMLARAPGDAPPRPARELLGEDHRWFGHQALSLHQLDPDMLVPVLAGPAHMLGDYAPRQMLPAITCPVLLLAADPYVGAVLQADEVRLALSLLPDATCASLQGIGHPLHGSHPRETLEAISPFLDRVRVEQSVEKRRAPCGTKSCRPRMWPRRQDDR
jgi:pimeloyl-ACP methyl ester carboxylesterase